MSDADELHIPKTNDEAQDVVEFQERCQAAVKAAQARCPALPLGLMAQVQGIAPALVAELKTPGDSYVWMFGFSGKVEGRYYPQALFASGDSPAELAHAFVNIIRQSDEVPTLRAATELCMSMLTEMQETAREAEYYQALMDMGITPEQERAAREKALNPGVSVDAHIPSRLH